MAHGVYVVDGGVGVHTVDDGGDGPQVLVADNDDTGSEVAANTNHQENAENQQGADQKKNIFAHSRYIEITITIFMISHLVLALPAHHVY